MLSRIHNLILLIILVLNFFSSCHVKDKKHISVLGGEELVAKVKNDNLPFDSLLKRVDVRINQIWDPPIRMYGDKDFMTIYSNSDRYYDDFVKVFERKKYANSEKMICVFAAQKLKFDKYLKLSDHCIKMFKEKKISDDVLFFMLFPNGWKTKWRYAEKYSHANVRNLLKKALSSDNLSERSKIILTRLNTGAIWKEYQDNVKRGFPEE